jgi:hypothetical protein
MYLYRNLLPVRNILFYSLFFLIMLFSCEHDKKVDDEIEDDEREFVPGDLDIGIVDSVPITEAWKLVNSFNLKISDVWGHKYLSNLPYDSIDYAISYLNKKPYINDSMRWKAVKNGNVYIDKKYNKISVSCRLLNLSLENQNDWLKVVEVLKLYEVSTNTKVFYLNVPVGYELLWKFRFENEEMIRWASPNYYVKYLLPSQK